MALPGISRTGDDAEKRFIEATGATRTERAADGDAILDGKHVVEIKSAKANTLNQVRAVKYLTLVALQGDKWFVVPAHEVIALVSGKSRGQHTENPYESSTLNLRSLDKYIVEERHLGTAVREAAESAAQYPRLRATMQQIMTQSRQLADHSRATVNECLRQYRLID